MLPRLGALSPVTSAAVPIIATEAAVAALIASTRPVAPANGNAGDTATSTGQGWTLGGTTTLNGTLYERYTVGAATLLVDTDITQMIT